MLTNFPIERDIEIAYKLMKHWCDRFFPVVPYRLLQTTFEELEDVHGEIPEEDKRWSDPVEVRAFVNPEPPMQTLGKFGLEEERHVDMSISIPHLVAAGMATQDENYEVSMIARIGDHFTFHDVIYEVLVVKPGARFANTDLILYMDFHAEKYRAITADHFTP